MPLFRSIKQDSSSIVGLWLIKETYDQLFEEIKDFSFDLSQLNDFSNEMKKQQWLASRCLIKKMNQGVGRISYDSHGAPHTDNGTFISLSHSRDMVAVILNQEEDIGTDIQIINRKVERIKKKFCHRDELKFTSGPLEMEKLQLIWSAKEALYKKLKTPGLIFREELFIQPFTIEDKGILNAKVLRNSNTMDLRLKYEILGDYTFVYTLNT